MDEILETLINKSCQDVLSKKIGVPVSVCVFVESSEIFKDCHYAWNIFVNSDTNCSWGENNHTMVTTDLILNVFEDVDEPGFENEINTVIERLEKIGNNIYIDLES